MSQVERQFREVNTYNLFYSSLTPRATPSLADLGWRLPMMFYKIDDSYEGVTAHPDFVLYDGSVCLLVEVKCGNNIEERHIDQVSSCNDVSINGVGDELQIAEVAERTGYSGDISHVESCILYQDMDEEWIEDCRSYDDCSDMLSRMESEVPVLTQDYGGNLRRIAGGFEHDQLQTLFDPGIALPLNPKEEIMLTEQMEKEVLAVAICDIWGEQTMDYNDPIETNVNEVRDFFAPRFNIPPDRVNQVLFYLQEVGACDHVEDLTYRFSRNHLTEMLSIKEIVREQRVEERLEGVEDDEIPSEHQATLDMVTEDGLVGEDDR